MMDLWIVMTPKGLQIYTIWRNSLASKLSEMLPWSYFECELSNSILRGSFAAVRRATHKKSGIDYAVKIISKKDCKDVSQ